MAGDIPLPGVWRGGDLPPEFRGKPDGIQPWTPDDRDPFKERDERENREGCKDKFWPPFGLGRRNQDQQR